MPSIDTAIGAAPTTAANPAMPSVPRRTTHVMGETVSAPRAPQLPSNQVKRRSSQPILTWFQRKIGGKHVVRKRQGKELSNTTNSIPRAQPADATLRGRPGPLKIVIASSARSPQSIGSNGKSQRPGSVHSSHLSTSSSLRPGSAWSARDPIEADDDASIRPLPPTSPPSPVPSRSTLQSSTHTSEGYASDFRTARSTEAPSTKPTTLMSFDLGIGGHIAQAPSPHATRGPLFVGPPTPGSSPLSTRFPHLRSPSTIPPMSTSLSFAALPTSASAGGRTGVTFPNYIAESPNTGNNTLSPPVLKLSAQAPGHTSFHPRNNPRPASPPLDNASTLTLASSTFALSYASPRSRSLAADRDGGDAGASMRALRPSSRRGSWGSDETGWSAAGYSTHTGISSAGPGLLGFTGGVNPSVSGGHRRRGPGSVATAWSFRTGEPGPNDDGRDEEVCDLDPGDTKDDGLPETESQCRDFTCPEMPTTSPTSYLAPHEIPLPNSPKTSASVIV
ncbi:hypothetical protein BS47DRAFT_1341960 [Hydnum rufescens UP504]|uniref:Uncharacterized protein n=1 Tax=Hydnum rufescens UP504 TaxID=1448309 RepID=A0A9P6B0Z2_9AGAM|nr:hypothetical protein BS47DRAFT_1341960 [Hydnum rufescens UP504]